MSSWHLDQLKYAFGIGGLFTFYGFAAFIAYYSSVNIRYVVIALIILSLPVALIIGFVTMFKKGDKKDDKAKDKKAEEGAAEGDKQKLGTPQNYEDLNKGTDEAIKFLQESNLGGVNGKEAIYSLPFYLVAGLPRSGKTSLALSSTLDFKTLPSQRQSEQNFIRPTKNVDWRVASEAVLLDSAGRYQTEGADQDEWASLIELLRKNRGNRPLDGFILTISTEKLLQMDEAEIEKEAKLLRTRIDEVSQRTKVRFPVYIVFTNADAIEGFRDSFSLSQKDGQRYVWGATFPLEKAENAHALFDAEFDLLQQSLQKRRLLRLSSPFPPVRQLRIFNFPAYFGSTRRKLGHFINTLFRPNPFSQNPLFRGFYFTANLVGKTAGQAPISSSVEDLNAQQAVGQTYFAPKFFRDVLLRDKNLVATFLAQKKRPPILGWILIVLGTLITLFLLAMGITSLISNKMMLDDVVAKDQAVLQIIKEDEGKDPLTKDSNQTRREIEATRDLKKVVEKLDNWERNGAPLYMRFGMYSGERILRERLMFHFNQIIENRFKKPTVKKLEADLRKFANNPTTITSAGLTDETEKLLDDNYNLLEAYLMLTGKYKDQAVPDTLEKRLKPYWIQSVKEGQEGVAEELLNFYVKQVDRNNTSEGDSWEFPRIQQDDQLVDNVRKKLTAFPAVARYYKRKITQINKEVDPMTVESILKGQGQGVLEGSNTVPGAYTLTGRQKMQLAIVEANAQLGQPDWVMGEESVASKLATSQTDIATLENRYQRDYAFHWKEFVKGVKDKMVERANAKQIEEVKRVLEVFSTPQSPIEILLKEVATQTNWSAKPKATDWWGMIWAYFQQAKKDPSAGNSEPEKEFKPLFEFVGTDEKPSERLLKYRAEIGKANDSVKNANAGQLQDIAKDLDEANQKLPGSISIVQAEKGITNLVKDFNTQSTQDIGDLLKTPIDNLRANLGVSSEQQFEKAWQDLLVDAQKVEKGFPFEDSSDESKISAMNDFFNPVSGKLSKFYKDKLANKHFEEADGEYKVKDTSTMKDKFSPDFVKYINAALKMRDALYGKNSKPGYEYEFTLTQPTSGAVEGSIDGEKIDTNGASKKMRFPADQGDTTGVLLTFVPSDDGGTTTPSPTPSSSSNSNSSSNANANVSRVQPKPKPTTESGSNEYKKPGEWGLFRMLAENGQKSGDLYKVTLNFKGKSVTATVKPSGAVDLFDRSLFKVIKAPSQMLK
jgi:type VI secretion system protein ImpL